MDQLSQRERALIAAMQTGLPLVPHPYAVISEKAGLSEAEVIEQLARWQHDGTIRRMGVIVRHHELGYRDNAMVVWDIPDTQVRQVGLFLGEQPFVTLCYQRPRRLPAWPYNLFCMIHGRDRAVVIAHVHNLLELLAGQYGLPDVPHDVLFSRSCFKQRGAQSMEPGSQASDRPAGAD